MAIINDYKAIHERYDELLDENRVQCRYCQDLGWRLTDPPRVRSIVCSACMNPRNKQNPFCNRDQR